MLPSKQARKQIEGDESVLFKGEQRIRGEANIETWGCLFKYLTLSFFAEWHNAAPNTPVFRK